MSPKSMATAVSTFQPTDFNTSVECDSENPIETQVSRACRWELLIEDDVDGRLFTTRGSDTILPVVCIGGLGLTLKFDVLVGGGTAKLLCN